MEIFVPICVALIVSVLAPMIVARQVNKSRRAEKIEDWKREDAVAAKLLTSNARLARVALSTEAQLSVIHTLVNSSMSGAIQSELDATRDVLAMMEELVAVNRSNGQEPSLATLAAIKGREAKIRELEHVMLERGGQDVIASKQIIDAMEEGVAADASLAKIVKSNPDDPESTTKGATA